MEREVVITETQAARVFEEWEKRYRENPEKFESDFNRYRRSTESYGVACAPYFLQLHKELFPPKEG